jgi:hypothetical protein
MSKPKKTQEAIVDPKATEPKQKKAPAAKTSKDASVGESKKEQPESSPLPDKLPGFSVKRKGEPAFAAGRKRLGK